MSYQILCEVDDCHIVLQDGGHSVRVWPCLTFKKSQSYWHTIFRPDTSIHGRDITTSGFENKRPPYWNSTSGFDFGLSLSSACGFPSACQLSSESDHPHSDPTCSACGEDEETTLHYLGRCYANSMLRHTIMGSYCLQSEELDRVTLHNLLRFARASKRFQ